MRCLLILMCLATSIALQAQNDKLFLKNGSQIKGTLLLVDNTRVDLQIGEDSELSIPLKDIQYVKVNRRKNSLSASAIKKVDSLNRLVSGSRFYHQLRLGILNGRDDVTQTSFSNLSFDYTFHYKTPQSWHMGLGVGFDQYPSFETVPIMVELRKDLIRSPSPLFVYGRLGHAPARIRNDFLGGDFQTEGGMVWALGTGYQWALGKSAILFGAGFRKQQIETVWTAGDFRSVTEWTLNRLDFKIGLIF